MDRPYFGDLSKAQRLLLAECESAVSTAVKRADVLDAAVRVSGKRLQTAENLEAKGLVELVKVDGWSYIRRVLITAEGRRVMHLVHAVRRTPRWRCRHGQ